MTIALIAHYLGPKMGIGAYLDRLLPHLVQELKDKEIKVKIVASPNAVENTPALKNLGDIVSILPQLDLSPAKRYIWFINNFAKYCRQEGITRVLWLSNPIVLPWHPPSIAVLHDVNEWKAKNKYGNRLNTTLRAWVYLESSILFAKKIIFVSQSAEKDFLDFRSDPKTKAKLKTIPIGVDSELAALPSIEINAPDRPFLLSVGRIDPAGKRLPEAVALVSSLREISSENWEIYLVGGMNAPTQAAGEAFLQSIEDKSWVHYLGYVDDRSLAEWYRRAKGIVFLSDNEGFGSPIAEAASFGRWVIVSDKNQASGESGGEAIIPVNPEDSLSAALIVFERLQTVPTINTNSSTQKSRSYADAAKAYAEEISTMFV